MAPTKRKVIASLKVGDFSEGFDYVTINGFEIKLLRALSLDIKNELEQINKIFKKKTYFSNCFVDANIQKIYLIRLFIML